MTKSRVPLVFALMTMIADLGSMNLVRADEPLSRKQQLAAVASVVATPSYDPDNQKDPTSFPMESSRLSLAVKASSKVKDPQLSQILTQAIRIHLQHDFNCHVIDTAVTSKRMDEQFLKSQAEKWKALLKEAELTLFLGVFRNGKIGTAFENDVYGVFLRQFRESYDVGLAQTLREEMATRRQLAFQKLWDEKLLPEFQKQERKQFDEQAVVIGRRNSCTAMCSQNVAKQNLTNVVLDLTLNGPAGKSIRRTYFFSELHSGQMMALQMENQFWGGSVGYALTADSLRGEVVVLCDEGKQGKQIINIDQGNVARYRAKPQSNSKGNAKTQTVQRSDFIAGQVVDEKAVKNEADAMNALREIAKRQEVVILFGKPIAFFESNQRVNPIAKSRKQKPKSQRMELHVLITEATSPLLSLGGVPIIDAKSYLRIRISNPENPQKTVDLDGHFDKSDPGIIKLDLYTHGNVDAPLDERLKHFSKYHDVMTFEGGTFSMELRGEKFLPKVATDTSAQKPDAEQQAESDEKQATSKLAQARSLFDKGQTDNARKRLAEIVEKYPMTKAAGEAKMLLDKH